MRSTDPLQVSTASGAAGTHLGPRALGVALELNQRHGLTKRKTCTVLGEWFGLRLSPGGLVQAAHPMAGKRADDFESLKGQARSAPFIHADETSWWVGGPKWWLWVFTHPDMTLYRIRASRGREVIYETLGTQYQRRSRQRLPCDLRRCLRAPAAPRRYRPQTLLRQPHRRGARTWEILASFAATLAQRQESFRDFIQNAARLKPNIT